MRSRARHYRFVTLAMLFALAGCSDRVPVPLQTPPGAPTQILGHTVPVRGRETIRGATASIEAFDDFFAPTILSGPPGKEVLLLLRNGGEHVHNFSLPSVGFDRDLPPGDIREVRASFPTTSELVPFFCKYHRDSAAMLGALTSP